MPNALNLKNGQWVVDQNPISKISLPKNLIDLLLSRFLDLDKTCQEILLFGGLIGNEFKLSPISSKY